MRDSNYKRLYNDYKASIANENNQDQIIFICSKTRQSIKLFYKAAIEFELSERDEYMGKVYVFLFHYRLIEFDKQVRDNSIAILENSNEIQHEFIESACRHFELSPEEIKIMKVAFKDISEPVGLKSPISIKLGHDIVSSFFVRKKLIENLNNLFSELEFYFPALESKFNITDNFVEYLSKTKFHIDYLSAKRLTRKVKNKKTLIKYIQKQKGESSLLNNKQAMTIIKTSSRNQVDLVNIADKKAGIMITVNSILLTLLIPMFASYLFDFSKYIFPIATLTITCGLTILLATLATRPSMLKDKITSQKIQTGQKSIFYFKNFSTLSKSDFTDEVRNLITQNNSFEQSVFADLYDAGMDLDRTYKQLRWCYTVFGSGIILTMISFLLSIVISTV